MSDRGGGGLLVAIGGAVAAALVAPLALVLVVALVMTAQHTSTRHATPGGGAGFATLKPDGIPADWVPWIIKAGGICPQVSAPLVAAQLKVESDFTSPPPNHAGAAGPAQFTGAAWAADGVDGDGDGDKDRMSVPDAVMALATRDCAAWKALAPAFPSNTLDVVLAAYNAGPGAVQQYAGVPPYPETTTYIARIKELIAQFTASVAGGGWAYPMAAGSYTITNTFGYVDSLYANTAGWVPYHSGTDFAAPEGTPVYAAASGKVRLTQTVDNPVIHWSWGNMATIDHGMMPTANGQQWVQSVYVHLASLAVHDGDTIQAGQLVGTVGTTGRSFGAHLHFEIHLSPTSDFPWGSVGDANFTDPIPWLDAHVGQGPAAGPGAQAAAFATSQIGRAVETGGLGPDTWDGVGLARAAWRAAGVSLPETIAALSQTGNPVPADQAAAGDLVIVAGDVGIATGDGGVITASGATVARIPLSSTGATTIRRPAGA